MITLAATWRVDLREKNEIGGIIRSLARRQDGALANGNRHEKGEKCQIHSVLRAEPTSLPYS